MSLLEQGDFTLHSGDKSWWKINCDAFKGQEAILARMIWEKLFPMDHYEQVIHPESRSESIVHSLAKELRKDCWKTSVNILLIDDVLTTGKSMEELKATINQEQYFVHGVVIFDRSSGKCPDWIKPLFTVNL